MKIALLSDIHGNLQALQSCLDDARANGASRFVFLGDFVGYGADPHGVIDVVGEYVAQGAIAVRGNHDEAIYGKASYMNEMAMSAIDYTKRVLTPPQTRFLRNLPLIVREESCCFVHASAASPEKYPYVDSPTAALRCAEAGEAAHAFCGHVHEQRLYFAAQGSHMKLFQPTPGIAVPVPAHRRWVALVGSVGQPRDRNPQAAYAIFDRERLAITFCRVSYDHHAAAARIREVGLPESIAYRVESGI
jgi:diadenosine tetraphosphatase ApaH/serine/threonine PP2A family protein phosphatase